jgi:hypothetical protein
MIRAAWLVALVVSLAVLPGRLVDSWRLNERHANSDFGVFYEGARRYLSGGRAYDHELQIAPNLAPPHALLAFSPLVAMERQAAYVVWTIISFALIGASVWLTARELRFSLTWWQWTTAVSVVLSSGLAMATVASGNLYGAVALPLVLAWRSFRRGRTTAAAIGFGAVAAVKVMMLLPVLWLLTHGYRRASIAMVATVLIIAGAGIAMLGAPVYAEWFHAIRNPPVDGQYHGASLLQALTRAFGEGTQFAALADWPAVVRPTWALLSGLLVSATVIKKRSVDRVVTSLLACAILVSPIGWMQAMWWCLPPALAMASLGDAKTKLLVAIAVGILWLPDTAPLLGQPSRWLTVTLGASYTWSALLLWMAAVLCRDAGSVPEVRAPLESSRRTGRR